MFKDLLNRLVQFSNKDWHKMVYHYSTYLSIFIVLISYSGVIYINNEYINALHFLILYYVCMILFIHFNPFVKQSRITGHYEFDRKIAFSAGIILFTTTITKQISDNILNKN
jgi:hypothetical protein